MFVPLHQGVCKIAGAATSKFLRGVLALPGVKQVLAENLDEPTIKELCSTTAMSSELARALVCQLNAAGYAPSGGILGYHAYMAALEREAFKVGPFPSRYKAPGKPEGETPFGPTTMTLSLGKIFIGLKPGVIIDLMQRTIQDYLNDPEYSFRHELESGDIVAILPRGFSEEAYAEMKMRLQAQYGDRLKVVVVGFINGETLQTVEFPLPTNGEIAYAGFVTNLTRLARTGFDVEKAPRLHTGDKHRITLEFDNNGPAVIILTVGEQPIANLTVLPVIGAPATSESTVRGQLNPSGLQPQFIGNGTHTEGVLVLPGGEAPVLEGSWS